MFLGESWRVLDPIAAMVVSLLIISVAFEIGMPAIQELLEASLPEETVAKMYNVISATPGVCTFHRFASRRNGSMMILDFHIKVDPDITVEQGHRIASNVEHRLKEHFGQGMTVNIHVEPYHGSSTASDSNKMYR
jgi:cation diffusion facilitator family transporter